MQLENKFRTPTELAISFAACITLLYIGVYEYDCKPAPLAPLTSWTLFFLAPSIIIVLIFLFTRHSFSAIGAAAGVLVVLSSLSTVGCSEYAGGGASMLGIALFIIAPLASFACGGILFLILKKLARIKSPNSN